MLRTAPSLIVDAFENSLSTSYAATLARLSSGSFATSKKYISDVEYIG